MGSSQNPVGCGDALIFRGAEEVKGGMEPSEETGGHKLEKPRNRQDRGGDERQSSGGRSHS